MEFNTSIFLTVFLPLVLVLYYACPVKFKNYLLVFISLAFYAWAEPLFVFVLIVTTLLDYILARKISTTENKKNKKLFLITSLTINLSVLFVFKYASFFTDVILPAQYTPHFLKDLILPLGISFYTFESITYLVDVYRGDYRPQEKFSDYMLYIFLFPKLVAGPIVRYGEMATQLHKRFSTETIDDKLMGFYRLCLGLAKKMLIATSIQAYYTDIYFNSATTHIHPANAWIGAFAFSFQVYFDFSGYTDIALGLGRMLGFKLPENFNNPYTSQSISEFWRRWHITLGAWMMNYLYIPLGGNRISKYRTSLNLCIVFLVSGLWHKAGWTFIIWGALHGICILIEKLFLLQQLKRWPKLLSIVYTFSLITFINILFRSPNLDFAINYYKSMFNLSATVSYQLPYKEFWPAFILAAIFSFITLSKWGKKLEHLFYTHCPTPTLHSLLTLISLLLFIVSLSYITTMGFSPFVYFRF